MPVDDPQVAGWIDRVFNSTIGLPQQVIWRFGRAAMDPKIDVLSKKGILDPALIPFNMFSTHEEDVMPDYMAETLGFGTSMGRRGGTGWGSQLFSAIATDPLTYLSGGATGLAKTGKLATKAITNGSVKKVLVGMAEAAGKSIDELMQGMSPQQFVDEVLPAAGELLRDTSGFKAFLETRRLRKLSSGMKAASRLAVDQAKRKGAPIAESALRIADGIRNTGARQVAFGLPNFLTFGLKFNIDVFAGHSSWWGLLTKGVNGVGEATGRAFLTRNIVDLPVVRAALKLADETGEGRGLFGGAASRAAPGPDVLAAPLRHMRGGWGAGGKSRTTMEGLGTALTEAETASFQHWGEASTGKLMHNLNQFVRKGPYKGKRFKTVVLTEFRKLLKEGVDPEAAFKEVMRAHAGVSRAEAPATTWARLAGTTLPEGTDLTDLPAIFSKDPRKAFGQLREVLHEATDNFAGFSTAMQEGRGALSLAKTAAGAERLRFEAEWEVFGAVAETAFKGSEAFHKMINRVFKTGDASAFGEAEYAKFLSHAARSNDQVKVLADSLYGKLRAVSEKFPEWDREDFGKIIAKIMEVEALPNEIAASLQLNKLNPANITGVMRALDNFAVRQRRVMDAFEQLLGPKGLKDPAVREKLLTVFGDEVFPFLTRASETAAGRSSYAAEFKKLIGPAVREVDVSYTPEQLKRLRRVDNGHVVRGEVVLRTVTRGLGKGEVREVETLPGLVGRRAGELNNADLHEGIRAIEARGSRKLTAREVVDLAEDMPAVQKFAAKFGLSTEEVLTALSRKGPAATRIVPRKVLRAAALWKASRTSWTPAQSSAALESVGMVLRSSTDGLTVVPRAMPTQSSWAVVGRPEWGRGPKGFYTKGGPGSKTYATQQELMRDVRLWLDRNEAYVKRYGPQLQESTEKLNIRNVDLDVLRSNLSASEMRALKGVRTVFDESSLPEALHADHSRLTEVARRRKLPVEDALHESQIVPKTTSRVTKVAGPRGKDEFDLFFEESGIRIPEEDLPEWAVNWATSRFLMREVENALKRAKKFNLPLEVDPSILAELDDALQKSGTLLSDMVTSVLPKEVRDMLDLSRAIQGHSFEAARRSGVWQPGSPVAYLGRYLNHAARQKIARIIGEVEQADSEILMRLGVKAPHRFRRQLDTWTVDDLNNITAELRLAGNESGNARWNKWAKGIEKELEKVGLGVTGLRKLGTKLPWTQERVVSDPFLSLLQRLGASEQDLGVERFWDDMLAASGKVPGESMMLGGKIVGVIDEPAREATSKIAKNYPIRSVKRGKAGETVRMTEEGAETVDKFGRPKGKLASHTPRSIIIETPQGERHVIPNVMLDETGFGILDLDIWRANSATGKLLAKGELGFTPTPGQSFAQASLRSELHTKLSNAPLTTGDVEKLIGHNVAFGSQNVISTAVKTAARVHHVTPPILRTIDSINYMIKSFQTIYRTPFHTANVSSGAFQAGMAGASPRSITAATADTIRLMWGDTEYAPAGNMLNDLLEVGETASKGRSILAKGHLTHAARLHGSGELARYVDTLEELGINRFDDLVITDLDGSEIFSASQFIKMAGEMQLFGTYASSLTRGSRTMNETLIRAKLSALDPGALENIGQKVLGKAIRALGGTPGFQREGTEVFNRTMTAIALMREGHPMRRAMQITKEAHVPYEKLTWFEKNVIKRGSIYYTFPRHYMPWAWTRMWEDPAKMSRLSHFIRDQNLFNTTEGKVNLAVGDYRLDIGRMNANIDATMLLAAFGDRIFMNVAENALPFVDKVDARHLTRATSDAGLFGIGGVASLTGARNLISQGDRTAFGSPDMMQDAMKALWPVKMVAQLFGKIPTKEGESPFVQYTWGEKWITSSEIGVGVKKVPENYELRNALFRYNKQVRQLQKRRVASSRAGETRVVERLDRHIKLLTKSFLQIKGQLEQLDYK